MHSAIAMKRGVRRNSTENQPIRRGSAVFVGPRRVSCKASEFAEINDDITMEVYGDVLFAPRKSSIVNRPNRSVSSEGKCDGNGSPLSFSGDFSGLEPGRSLGRWEKIVSQYCTSDWNNLRKRIQNLVPANIDEIFNKAEIDYNIAFSMKERKLWYREFKGMSGDFLPSRNSALNWEDIEELVCHKLEMNIPHNVLQDSLKAKMLEARYVNKSLDFGQFVSLMCDIQKNQLQHNRNNKKVKHAWSFLVIQIPIDPDSGAKQSWDVFCMLLLLYCSFSIPFNVAFLNQLDTPDALQDFDLTVDSLFMFDIFLSFITWYDERGYIVRNQRQIAMHYLRTWFLPDFAGSFPFDQVIALMLEDQSGLSSTNFVRVLRFLRMIKLLRAVRLMNRLNRLKQKEGFEQFSNAIGVASAMFLIIFVAHLLGCCFTMLLDSEDGNSVNWLSHYNPDLPYADTWTRYVTAVYWAVVTITTMGYGDVVPVTHIERIYVIFVVIIGAVVFSYCMGTISSLISQVSERLSPFLSSCVVLEMGVELCAVLKRGRLFS